MVAFSVGLFTGKKNRVVDYKSYMEYPVYKGSDLWTVYKSKYTSFKIWAPTASEVYVHLYAEGDGDNRLQTYQMEPDVMGTWSLRIDGDHKGKYYTFQVKIKDKFLKGLFDIHVFQVIVTNERCQKGVEVGDGLGAGGLAL